MCVGRPWNSGIGDLWYYPKGCERPDGCKRPTVLSKKVLHGCERPAVLSGKFCMGVRDPRCNPKISLPKINTWSRSSLRPRVE